MRLRIETPWAVFGMAGLILMGAVFLNAILALINARGIQLGLVHIIVGEILIVAMAGALIGMKIGAFRNIYVPLLFLLVMAGNFLWVSLMNESVNAKAIRDTILIVVFFMIGGTMDKRNMLSTFRFITLTVLFFMVIENFLTDIYVALFEPAQYYRVTRNVPKLVIDETGLFRNALGYAGRFSFGLSDHRLSSIFLEQVSLANFAMVLGIFTVVFWPDMRRGDRVLFFLAVVLMLMTNDSRTGTLVCLLLWVGYFLFPRLPRYTHVAYMPLLLIMCAILFYDPALEAELTDDTVQGRVGYTMRKLATLGPQVFTGGTVAEINMMMDTGYSYFIISQTIFGLLAFWLFVSFVLPPTSPENIRFNHGAALYIFLNLLIGTAIFSIKVSAPLWIIAGYLYYAQYKTPEETGPAYAAR